jgi:hypothetical protein
MVRGRQCTDQYSEKSDVSKRKVVLGATKQLNEVWILLKGGDAFNSSGHNIFIFCSFQIKKRNK